MVQPAAAANDAASGAPKRRARAISTARSPGSPSTGACSRRPATPPIRLLERLRFLSISGNNLDEFFMVRVAGLKGQQLAGVEEMSADGLNPGQQLAAIAREADALTASQQQVWADLREALREAGVVVLGNDEIRRRGGGMAGAPFRRPYLARAHAPGDRSGASLSRSSRTRASR